MTATVNHLLEIKAFGQSIWMDKWAIANDPFIQPFEFLLTSLEATVNRC